MVCRKTREHVKKTHQYRLVRCGRFFRPKRLYDVVPTNPDTDTFVIPMHGGKSAPFPRNVPHPQGVKHGATPPEKIQHMRKLILFDPEMEPIRAVFTKGVPIDRLLSELNVPPQTAWAPAQSEQDELIPIDADWPERFSKLNDLTYVTRKTHYSWWIGGEYHVHGPDVGLEYYEKMGICDDTGTTWAFDETNSFRLNIWHFALNRRKGADPNFKTPGYLAPWYYKSIKMKYSRNTSAVVPKIGLRGYSYNTSSCGGFWAGYRLYLGKHPRLEFSPLVWDDVKEYLDAFQTHEDNREDCSIPTVKGTEKHYRVKGVEPSSPEMIVKISIIRPGEEAPPSHPHHCWEPVAGDFSNCGNLQGVDWRLTVPISPPPAKEEFKKFMAPGFNRLVSDKDKLLLCEREEKLLKNLNRFRI
ncbi:unnamed protein product [Clonostachys solani]|uniref:Uncharacterized protein n=1 Tax=Clonostachys solani TaxID=160281 RepID=A0A9P0ENH8_9HYPO|nr:unnamed protein product [Clonostachys solani]